MHLKKFAHSVLMSIQRRKWSGVGEGEGEECDNFSSYIFWFVLRTVGDFHNNIMKYYRLIYSM